MDRECMEFDVVVVGAGPAGLATACRLAQLAKQHQLDFTICVVEKGAEVGAHILSGAIFETRALDELFPDWEGLAAPLDTPVTDDQFCYLANRFNHFNVLHALLPNTLKNAGNYVISLANLCRWLTQQAERLGVEIYPGFAASRLRYNENGAVTGIVTSDMGLDKQRQQKASFEAGIELKAKYTVFAEGSRGHLGKQLIATFQLDQGKQPQHYALGLKELWEIPPERHQPGLVIHGIGWPLNQTGTTGGSFLYHLEHNQVAVGLIVDLNYANPYLSPFDEFQRLKHHPKFSTYLKGGQRIAYGARAISKGGLSSLPKQQFAGGLLIGCDAGTLNFAKIKGSHTAMKSGMLAAEAIFDELQQGNSQTEPDYQRRFNDSWLYQELNESRNFGAQIHLFGELVGGALATLEHNLLHHRMPWTFKDKQADHRCLKPIDQYKPLIYPNPDGILSFDKPSSVYLSATHHEEDQPCHLLLADEQLPVRNHLSLYDEPSQRYCPAGVYEIVTKNGHPRLQINAANCIHCKACDIKDPSQNITWVCPEGGGGPNYPNM
ncbi:electron transfer flavoprotein-ubiquinone oxidoreductase [Photobacterium lipolyticum]|uniref:Electron transfer flavoprotein-ubiquinone oxidoreductase n=1 Tax=Photobacterium lipolyticum TaxID=266810 RepID=A0A2T3MZI8_9GAMM|nr:electron transfer flavoprotein-ubiquinone oxidoreductase [Photobacterium lipolyticum]PSW05413.1 electron transfer flavoprotein-ubiquinone oxidoreductase [Photobacterium lipolyticum]